MSMNTAYDLNSQFLAPSLQPVAPQPTPVGPRLWSPFLAWVAVLLFGQLAVFVAIVCALVAVSGYLTVTGTEQAEVMTLALKLIRQPIPAIMLSLLPFQFTMGSVAVLGAFCSPEKWKQRLGLLVPQGKTGPLSVITLPAFTVAAAFATLVGSVVLLGESPTGAGPATGNDSWLSIVVIGVLLTIVPAIIEEIVFRGYIQRRLLARWSPAVAIGVTTFLFAILHFDSVQHIIAVIPLGIVTGLLAYRSNSVLPGMIVHGIHNAAAVAVGVGVKGLQPVMGNELLGLLVIGSIVVLGLIGLPAVILLVVRKREAMAAVAG